MQFGQRNSQYKIQPKKTEIGLFVGGRKRKVNRNFQQNFILHKNLHKKKLRQHLYTVICTFTRSYK